MISEERLGAAKRYMRVDFDEDDMLIRSLLLAMDGYLANAGIRRETNIQMYDLIVHDAVLRAYDGRDGNRDPVSALSRQMINQLKLLPFLQEEDNGAARG